jgi:hypothetical protein
MALLVAVLSLTPGLLPAQASAPRWTVGVAVGGAFARLKSERSTARGGTNVALAWRVMYHVSDHAAIGIHAGATPYHHTGQGRARRRGFEGLYPAVEWHPDAEHWLAAGLGLHLDAPVFYDVRPRLPGESRFRVGVGGLLAAGRRVTTPTTGYSAGELVARAWAGRVQTADGRLTGWAAALLAGGRFAPQ